MIWYSMLMYPAARFILEVFRGDAIRDFLFGSSMSQWITIGIFAAAVWKLFLFQKKEKKNAACAGLVLAVLLVAGTAPKVVYATENTVTQDSVTEETGQAEAETDGSAGMQAAATEMGQPTEEETGFNSHEKFVVFVCCLFSLALCVVIGLFGNPNDRLKDKYKRARKQQIQEEKRRREREKIAAMRATEEAKYAEELARYEADRKAYEEEKAAKEAAKAAKKAEKQARKGEK